MTNGLSLRVLGGVLIAFGLLLTYACFSILRADIEMLVGLILAGTLFTSGAVCLAVGEAVRVLKVRDDE